MVAPIMRPEARRIYEAYIVRWLAGLESGIRGLTNTSRHIKRWLIENRGEQCERCGWCEHHPITNNVPVELHHIDGNFENNRPENLQLLCPNCHSLTETFRNLNESSTRVRPT